MGKALQVVTGRVTNPGATITALTANTGDSFTVKAATVGSQVQLADMWAQEGTVGVFRIRSPLMHDAAQALRMRVVSTCQPLLPYEFGQPLQAQDVLTVELSGGGAEIDVGAYLVYYADLPGASARLATWEQIAPLIVNEVGLEQNLTSGGTGGQYGGSQPINTNFDILQRTKDYALLGYLCDTTACVVGVTGPDTSNLRVGGPGVNNPIITREWFVWNSQRIGAPMIPIINAANVGATLVDLAMVSTGTSVNVTLILAELNVAGGTLST
jgi:hypothetical protein